MKTTKLFAYANDKGHPIGPSYDVQNERSARLLWESDWRKLQAELRELRQHKVVTFAQHLKSNRS